MHNESVDSNKIGNIGLIAIYLVVWASNPIAIKFAIQAGWPPLFLGLFRMIFIGLFYWVWSLALCENLFGNSKTIRFYSIAASLCKGTSVIMFYLALSLIPAKRVIIISTISPIINLILVHFLIEQEKTTKNNLLGVLVSCVGISILLVSRENSPETAELASANVLVGDMLMIGNVILIQLMLIFEKKAFNHGATPCQLLNATNLFSIAAFILCLFLSEESLAMIPLTSRGITVYIYLITVSGVFLFYYRRWLTSKMELSYINSFSHIGKGLSIFYAIILLGEKFTISSISAFFIILVGTGIAANAPQKILS